MCLYGGCSVFILIYICILHLSLHYHHYFTTTVLARNKKQGKLAFGQVCDMRPFIRKAPPAVQRASTVGGLDKRTAEHYWRAYKHKSSDGEGFIPVLLLALPLLLPLLLLLFNYLFCCFIVIIVTRKDHKLQTPTGSCFGTLYCCNRAVCIV